MKTIYCGLVVGGDHDGMRIDFGEELYDLRLPKYDRYCSHFDPSVEADIFESVDVCCYDRMEFRSGDTSYRFWVPHGQDGKATMERLLSGYGRCVERKYGH